MIRTQDIRERFSCSKTGNPQDNEDGIFVNDHFAAVIDGATGKDQARLLVGTYGQIIRDSILHTLGTLEGDEDSETAVALIQNAVIADGNRRGIDRCMTASAVIYSSRYREIWMIGDCQAMVNGVLLQNTKRIDDLMSELRSFAIQAFLAQGHEEAELKERDYGREMILPFLKQQYLFENQLGPFGYCVFNNQPLEQIAPGDMVKVISVEAGAEVVLASDGYPMLCDTLEASEQALSEMIAEDPMCYRRYLTTKGVQEGYQSFDDRTYLKIVERS